jgi:hypothetical protein
MKLERRITELEKQTEHLKPPDPLEALLDLAATVMRYAERSIIETIEDQDLQGLLRLYFESFRNSTIYRRKPTDGELKVFYDLAEFSRMYLVAGLTLADPDLLKKEDREAAEDRIKELSPNFQDDPGRGSDLAEMVRRWSMVYDIDLIEKFIPDAKGMIKNGSDY